MTGLCGKSFKVPKNYLIAFKIKILKKIRRHMKHRYFQFVMKFFVIKVNSWARDSEFTINHGIKFIILH